MSQIGKTVIIAGIFLIIAGIIMVYIKRLPPWLGRLPGDIHIKKENFSFYFPLTTCILISVLITLIMYIIRLFNK